jgi:GDP-L-fucose synthase
MWDSSKPDGTPRKVLDVSRLKALGWQPKVSLDDGIKETIQYFEANYN